MAKIKSIDFDIDGVNYSSNINVNSKGEFNLKLDWQVANAIGVDSHIYGATLNAIESVVLPAYNDYLKASTKTEMVIEINYSANGWYNVTGTNNSKFLRRSFSSDQSTITFEFKVLFKQTRGERSVWFLARKGINFGSRQEDPNQYYKAGQTYQAPQIYIPYSREAEETLLRAKEGLKSISGILLNLVDQEPEMIEAMLIGKTNLLSLKP
jgi:hypothetical protein